MQARGTTDSRVWRRAHAQHEIASIPVNKFQALATKNLNVKGIVGGLKPLAQTNTGMGE